MVRSYFNLKFIPIFNRSPVSSGSEQLQNHNVPVSQANRQNYYGDNVSLSGSTAGDNKGTITKKSLNIFSTYVKSGLEGYILGE